MSSEHKFKLETVSDKEAQKARDKARIIMPKGVRTKAVKATRAQAPQGSPGVGRRDAPVPEKAANNAWKAMLAVFVVALLLASDLLPFLKNLVVGDDDDDE